VAHRVPQERSLHRGAHWTLPSPLMRKRVKEICLRVPGDALQEGACRKSCRLCEPCEEGDSACYSRNRMQAGYLPLDDNEL
jgi:hypothetical protein